MAYPWLIRWPGLVRLLLVILIAGTQLRHCIAVKPLQPAKRTTRSARVAPNQTSSSSSSTTLRGRGAAADRGRGAAIAPAATDDDAGEKVERTVEPGVTFVVKAFANEGHEDVVQHNIDHGCERVIAHPNQRL